MSDRPEISSQRVVVDPSKGATLREPAYSFEHAAPPDPTRLITPDATGYYEALADVPGGNATHILQMNQAGHAIVGWLTPAGEVDPSEFPVRCAVLVAEIDSGQGPFPLFYRTDLSIQGLDPDAVLHPYEPWQKDASGPPPEKGDRKVCVGFIEFKTTSDSWPDGGGPKLEVTLKLKDESDRWLPPLILAQRSQAARPSERLIESIHDVLSLKNAIIARTRKPIPTTFFDTSSPGGQRWRRAELLFTDGSQVAQLIEQYAGLRRRGGNVDVRLLDRTGTSLVPMTLPAASARGQTLRDIAQILSSVCNWQGTHQKYLDMMLTRLLFRNGLNVGGEVHSYRDWLAAFVSDEGTGYPPAFDRFMAGAHVYRYKLTFEQVGIDIDKGLWIHGEAFLFLLTIEAQIAPASCNGGYPTDSDFVPATDPNDPNEKRPFKGAFFQVKLGLGGPPEIPDVVYIPSGVLFQPHEFDGAYFELYAMDAAVGVQAAVINPMMTLGGKVDMAGTSMLLRIHVRDHVLDGSCESGHLKPTWSGVHDLGGDAEKLRRVMSHRGIAEPTDFLDFPKSLRDIATQVVRVSGGVSVGLGLIGNDGTLGRWMAPPAPVVERTGLADAGAGRSVTACFERNSARLLADVNGWEARFLFELVLAIELALFKGAPKIGIEGSASPEFVPGYNRALSKDRALQLKRAIVDALGPAYEVLIPDQKLGDKGDFFAVHVAHLEEPDAQPGLSAEERRRRRNAVPQRQRDLWPLFRKADLSIRGQIAIRVFTTDGPDVDLDDRNAG